MPYGPHFSVASDPTVRFEENWDFKHQKLKVRATRNQAGIIQTRELSTMLATKKPFSQKFKRFMSKHQGLPPKNRDCNHQNVEFSSFGSGSKP